MYFPITCVDNFFDNPQEVRDLALSLEFNESSPTYPGKRTKELYEVAPDYFDYFCKKLMSIFYDFDEKNVSWQISTTFQKIEPFKNKQLNKGWVHADSKTMFAGIVYLNNNSSLESGTSIYKPKTIGLKPTNIEQKHKFFATNEGDEEMIKCLNENNERFIETITFKNVYNRMICYGGEQYHGVNSYIAGEEPRLTQVFFVQKVLADWYPIPNSKMVK
jgi:hypothetical protein